MVSLKGRRGRRRTMNYEVADDLEESLSTETTLENLDSPGMQGRHTPDASSNVEDVTMASSDKVEKEQATWDAFREEYYEALEQLPLSLHRAFSLIKELDSQGHGQNGKLLSSLQNYLQLRESLAFADGMRAEGSVPDVPPLQDTAPEEVPHNDSASRSRRVSGRFPAKSPSKPSASPRLSTRGGATVPTTPPKAQAQSSALLTDVARISEDLVRAANERVNVARFASDLVNRHIKDLDRAIKEQETSISLGLRPGTHPASTILPELVIPKSRPNGTAQDSLSDSDEPAQDMQEELKSESNAMPGAGALEEEKPPKLSRKRGKSKSFRRKSEVGQSIVPEPEPDKPELSPEGRATRVSRTLKLTVPPMSAIAAHNDLAIDPDEPRYCYCNQVSYGEMVACDNASCEREWFHVGCLGLEHAPTTSNWYCPDCQVAIASKRRKVR